MILVGQLLALRLKANGLEFRSTLSQLEIQRITDRGPTTNTLLRY